VRWGLAQMRRREDRPNTAGRDQGSMKARARQAGATGTVAGVLEMDFQAEGQRGITLARGTASHCREDGERFVTIGCAKTPLACLGLRSTRSPSVRSSPPTKSTTAKRVLHTRSRRMQVLQPRPPAHPLRSTQLHLIQLASHPADVLHHRRAVRQGLQLLLERLERRFWGTSLLRSMLHHAARAVMDRNHAALHDVVGAVYPVPYGAYVSHRRL
jgi:hypothetical protein